MAFPLAAVFVIIINTRPLLRLRLHQLRLIPQGEYGSLSVSHRLYLLSDALRILRHQIRIRVLLNARNKRKTRTMTNSNGRLVHHHYRPLLYFIIRDRYYPASTCCWTRSRRRTLHLVHVGRAGGGHPIQVLGPGRGQGQVLDQVRDQVRAAAAAAIPRATGQYTLDLRLLAGCKRKPRLHCLHLHLHYPSHQEEDRQRHHHSHRRLIRCTRRL